MRRKVEQEGYLQSASKNNSPSLSISHGYVKTNSNIMGFPHHSPSHAQLPLNYAYITDTHRVSWLQIQTWDAGRRTMINDTDCVAARDSLFDVDVCLIVCAGTVPHGIAFEHPEHSPAWNRCYTGKNIKEPLIAIMRKHV